MMTTICLGRSESKNVEQTSSNFAFESRNVVRHLHGVREGFLLPHKVLVVVRVLDVEPEDIDGHIFLVKTLLYSAYIVAADVVPPTLVVAKAPVRWKHRCARQARVLREYVRG